MQFKEVNYKQKSVMSVQYSNFSCLLVLGVVSMMCVILGVASPVTGPESVLAGDDAAVPAVDMAAVPAVAGAPVVDAGRAATVAACRRCLASHYSLLCVFSMFVDFLVHNAILCSSEYVEKFSDVVWWQQVYQVFCMYVHCSVQYGL